MLQKSENINKFDILFGSANVPEYKCELFFGNTIESEYKIISINENNLLESNE